jgi:tetratricopeptide (TPR) repeat protein
MSEAPLEDATTLLAEFTELRSSLEAHDYAKAIELLQNAFNGLMKEERFSDALTLHKAILAALPDVHQAAELRRWCFLGVGNAYFHLNQDADAEIAYTNMLTESRDTEDSYLESVALARLGDLARKRGQSHEAEQFYLDSIESKIKAKDYFSAIEPLIFLAMIREEAGRLDSANSSLKGAETILRTLRRAILEVQSPEHLREYQYWEMALWFQQASLLRAEGNLPKATRIYRKALKAAHERGDTLAEAKLLQNLANNLVAQGMAQKAVLLYENSLKIALEQGFQETAYHVQLGLAIALFNLKRHIESIPYYESVRRVAEVLGDEERWASLTADTGAVYLEVGEMEKGISLLQQALAYFRGVENIDWQELILHNLLIADARQGDATALQAHLHECLNLLPQTAFPARRSLFGFVGVLNLDTIGDVQGAARCFRQAVAEAEAEGDVFQAGQTAALAAASLADKGADKEALSLFDRAAEIFVATGDDENLWNTRNDRGNTLARLGNYEEAIEEYTWCLQKAIDRQDQILESQALLNCGETKRRMGDIEEAISLQERALILYRAMEDQEGELDALNALGLCLLDESHYGGRDRAEDASVYFNQALLLAKYRKDRSQEAMATRGLAHIAERQGEIVNALNLYLKAADLWECDEDYLHCAEALASRVTLQILQYKPRRWQKDVDRLTQVAIAANNIGIAARGIMGAAGHLMQAGRWEVAAEIASLALTLNKYQSAYSSSTRDEEIAENDLYDILVYVVNAMDYWMSPEDSALFLERLTNLENVNQPTNGQILRDNIEFVRSQLVGEEIR